MTLTLPYEPSIRKLINLLNVRRPSLLAWLSSNLIGNERRRPKVDRQYGLSISARLEDIRNVEPPLSELIVRAGYMLTAEIEGGKRVQSIELQPGAASIRRESTDRCARVGPVVPHHPTQIEVVEIVVGIPNDILCVKIQMRLAG